MFSGLQNFDLLSHNVFIGFVFFVHFDNDKTLVINFRLSFLV